APGNALIRRDNPEMTDDLIAYGIRAMRDYGIVDSGDSLERGIGAMTRERWDAFFAMTVETGIYPPDLDHGRAFSLEFVNGGVGLDLKRQLQGG
ncbi:MAG TPA: hypothetical protein VFG47_18640, partial [Geminicoccaceae bacterium]|nr:hypothetical protein [Geminicoccaceae bacterium]